MSAHSTAHDGRYALELDDVHFEVEPRVGGRVTSYRIGGVDVLSGSDVDANNYGSTFWTSPQSDWGWPPPAELDRSPYSIVSEGDTITLASPRSDALGIRVTKQFSADRVRGAIILKYTIHNLSHMPKRYAPWEVTRVRSRGLTFFPSGAWSTGPLRVERLGAATWYAHNPDLLTETGQKALANGTQGFLAHAAQRFLYIKSFANVPPEQRAPGEAEVEIYANNRYVEAEVQGPYTTIEPGSSASWAVAWYLRRLPHNMVAFPGNAELLAFAASVIRATIPPVSTAQLLTRPTPHSLG
jgi:hypothetical protein